MVGFGANGYDDHSPNHYGLAAAFIVEVVLTAFLVLTVLGATDVAAPVGIPVTNTSVNPARSIGPALFVGGLGARPTLAVHRRAPARRVLGAGIYLAIRAPAPAISVKEAEQALVSEQAERRGRSSES